MIESLRFVLCKDTQYELQSQRLEQKNLGHAIIGHRPPGGPCGNGAQAD
jgi:hypothetical protein